jgi:putative transposase
MLKAYKYRIYPTADQMRRIDQSIGVCRLVYNLALEAKIRAWQAASVSLTSFDLINQLPELKQAYPWMREVDSQSVQASIRKLDQAFQRFYHGNGFPKFRSKKNGGSYQCPNNTRRIDWGRSTLCIPKISNISIELCRKFQGEIRSITISKTPTGKYFASILVKNDTPVPVKPAVISERSIGIDVGIKSFAVISDGRAFEPNRRLKDSLKRLQCLQRRASRKKRGGNNRKKANKKVTILHEKITNRRTDYIHKTTTQLIRDNQTDSFVIEDLAVANMVKNRKLSQALSDVSFGEFFRQLKYKCEWYGKNLIVIDRFAPSSKRCSGCGAINQELALADREWTCACGSHHDRDINAAKNIKYYGLLKHSGEGISGGPVESRRLRRAKKQEKKQ